MTRSLFNLKTFIWAAICLVLAATPRAWASQNELILLRFGVLPVVDTLPLIVGQEQGFFNQEGLALKLVTFQSALERDAAMQAGALDGYFGDILNTILLIQSGQKVKIITTVFHTQLRYRMFGIATSPKSGIDQLAGLKGQKIAISRATIIEYLLDRILAANGLGRDHVEKLEIKKMPIRLQMLMSGQVAAALLPEPLLTLAQSKGAKVIADDRDLNTSETVLALDTRFADPSLIARFLGAYSRTVATINKNPEAFKTLLVERTRFPKPIEHQYQVPQFPAVGLPSALDVAQAQAWLKENGVQETRLTYEQIVYKPIP